MASGIAGDERQRHGRIGEKRCKEENEHDKTTLVVWVSRKSTDMGII